MERRYRGVVTTSPNRVAGDSFVGATLDGRYRLDGLVGRGGMASVYRGVDLTLGRPVAVKVFAESAEGIDDAERRKSETALLASVSHRALVRLYDACKDPSTGREFLVMELVEGRDLREALRLGPIGPADAAGLLADLGEGLHVIHERGMIHRDVKPANVLLEPAQLPTRTWNAKLADFGIARLIDDARLTRAGLLVGTPGYLSPEQVTGSPPGPPADVYSLGLLVLEARTGETPFPGPAMESASARLSRDPGVPEWLGADWVALLRAMTARDPAERPTALEVAVAATTLHTAPTEAEVQAPTAPTVALADVAEQDTVASSAVHDDASPISVDASRPADAAEATAQTRVLPSPDPSFFPVPAAGMRTVPLDAQPASSAAIGGATIDTSRRWVRPAIAVALLAVMGVVLFALFQGSLTPAAETTPTPLPAVPGELGVHLEQLDEAVSG